MGKAGPCPHIHPCEVLAHRGPPFGPDALRLPYFLKMLKTGAGQGTCPPLADRPEVGGRERQGKASPYPRGARVGAFPAVSMGHRPSVGRFGGREILGSPDKPRSCVQSHSSPVAAFWPLGGALEESRCSAYGTQGQPGTVGRVGVKSVEGYTPAMVDVQPCANAPGNG